MSADQAVLTATAAAVAISIVLVVVGVAMLASVGWALVTAGALISVAAVSGAVVLLRDHGDQ